MKERDSAVGAMPVEKTDAHSLGDLLAKHVDPGATVYTEEYKGYHGIPSRRGTVRHSAGE